jgi:hypothetical protein
VIKAILDELALRESDIIDIPLHRDSSVGKIIESFYIERTKDENKKCTEIKVKDRDTDSVIQTYNLSKPLEYSK